MIRAIACAVGLVFAAVTWSPAWAGRPLITEDTGTLDPGIAELELSFDYIGEGRTDVFLLPIVFNLGLLPRLEVSLGAGLIAVDPSDAPSRAGPSDSAVRLKYRFLDETERAPALMGALTARLPTGDERRGLGDRGVDVQALAIAGKTLGPVTVTVNGGYTFVTEDRDGDVVSINAAVEAPIARAWSLVAEMVSDILPNRRADDRVLLRAGTVYAISERVRLDATAGFGATRAGPDVILGVGLTVILNPRLR